MTPIECPACGWWHPQDRACARCARLPAPIAAPPVTPIGLAASPVGIASQELIRQQEPDGVASNDSTDGLGAPEPQHERPPEPTGPYGQAADVSGVSDDHHAETPDETPDPPAAKPEVGTLRKPSHGVGLILYGNPGNRGGGRHAEPIKAQLRRLIDLHGLPFLERVIRRAEVDVKIDRHGERHHVPNSVTDAIRAVAVAIAAAEARPAPEQLPVDPRHAGDAPRVWRFEPPLRIERAG